MISKPQLYMFARVHKFRSLLGAGDIDRVNDDHRLTSERASERVCDAGTRAVSF